MKQDVVKYAKATILCETNGKSDWLQAGEMIQVGLAWRIIDAPTAHAGIGDLPDGGGGDGELLELMEKLRKLDGMAPKFTDNTVRTLKSSNINSSVPTSSN